MSLKFATDDLVKIDPHKSSAEAKRLAGYLSVLEDGPSDMLIEKGRGYLNPLLLREGVSPAKRDDVFLRPFDIPTLAELAFRLLVLLETEVRPHRRRAHARELERVWVAILRRWKKDAPRRK
jgi:hypothetical protein